MSIVNAWYARSVWLWLLWPVSLLFRFLAARRRIRLERERMNSSHLPPIIVVGNISVGGTGKTPLVVELARRLEEKGWKPAIVSRGYGGRATEYPIAVNADSLVDEVGDEAILIQRSVTCPFFVDPKRLRAVEHIATLGECDVIISDDGLQHYEMGREIEIVVVDAQRLLGNELCLPAGPLREPKKRLSEVDFLVLNGGDEAAWHKLDLNINEQGKVDMHLAPSAWVNVSSAERVGLAFLPVPEGADLHAIAGIGNPQRFFTAARALGYQPLCHPFPDHYRFAPEDFCWASGSVVIMTHKDAVKCERFSDEHYWYLEVRAQLSDEFFESVYAKLGHALTTKTRRT